MISSTKVAAAVDEAMKTSSSGVSALSPPSRRLKFVRRRLACATVCDNIIGDLLAFAEVPYPGALGSAYVHEHIGSTACRLNEAEALRRIEPFYCPSSRRHLFGAVALARLVPARECHGIVSDRV
jgi:hypothetical protein